MRVPQACQHVCHHTPAPILLHLGSEISYLLWHVGCALILLNPCRLGTARSHRVLQVQTRVIPKIRDISCTWRSNHTSKCNRVPIGGRKRPRFDCCYMRCLALGCSYKQPVQTIKQFSETPAMCMVGKINQARCCHQISVQLLHKRQVTLVKCRPQPRLESISRPATFPVWSIPQ